MRGPNHNKIGIPRTVSNSRNNLKNAYDFLSIGYLWDHSFPWVIPGALFWDQPKSNFNWVTSSALFSPIDFLWKRSKKIDPCKLRFQLNPPINTKISEGLIAFIINLFLSHAPNRFKCFFTVFYILPGNSFLWNAWQSENIYLNNCKTWNFLDKLCIDEDQMLL